MDEEKIKILREIDLVKDQVGFIYLFLTIISFLYNSTNVLFIHFFVCGLFFFVYFNTI